jgi:ubiquinone/menaquinone biosynthesis C-methylase UbiE
LRLARAGARVIGSDFTPEMLVQSTRALREIVWVQADALELPFPTEVFDVVTDWLWAAQPFRLFTSASANSFACSNPADGCSSSIFGKPANHFGAVLYFAYLRVVVPVFGLIFCGDSAAYSYILESLSITRRKRA